MSSSTATNRISGMRTVGVPVQRPGPRPGFLHRRSRLDDVPGRRPRRRQALDRGHSRRGRYDDRPGQRQARRARRAWRPASGSAHPMPTPCTRTCSSTALAPTRSCAGRACRPCSCSVTRTATGWRSSRRPSEPAGAADVCGSPTRLTTPCRAGQHVQLAVIAVDGRYLDEAEASQHDRAPVAAASNGPGR